MMEQVQEEELDYNVFEINQLREQIEKMSKFNQIEILRIMQSHNEVTINENKYGIHINLSELTSQVIHKMRVYIDYVSTQEMQLSHLENEKEHYKNIYFVKDNKDNATVKDKDKATSKNKNDNRPKTIEYNK
jgi:hypothetical protein